MATQKPIYSESFHVSKFKILLFVELQVGNDREMIA
jgi:hypothetical protein